MANEQKAVSPAVAAIVIIVAIVVVIVVGWFITKPKPPVAPPEGQMAPRRGAPGMPTRPGMRPGMRPMPGRPGAPAPGAPTNP